MEGSGFLFLLQQIWQLIANYFQHWLKTWNTWTDCFPYICSLCCLESVFGRKLLPGLIHLSLWLLCNHERPILLWLDVEVKTKGCVNDALPNQNNLWESSMFYKHASCQSNASFSHTVWVKSQFLMLIRNGKIPLSKIWTFRRSVHLSDVYSTTPDHCIKSDYSLIIRPLNTIFQLMYSWCHWHPLQAVSGSSLGVSLCSNTGRSQRFGHTQTDDSSEQGG